jgi:hypothetical protein
MRNEIILIGPLCSGKTSVALYLAEALSIRNYPVDRIKWYYRFKNGYDLATGTKILRTQGFAALLDYAYPYFSLKDIQLLLDEFRNGVVDFGASHSYYENEDLLREAVKMLAPFPNVVLLLPSADVEESIRTLRQRIRERYSGGQRSKEVVQSYVDANERFVRHGSNAALAKHVVYTQSKSIKEVGNEVLWLTGYPNE